MTPEDIELKKPRLQLRSSLANNLCPDHRDKQDGKPCLACNVETLQRQLAEAQAESERLKGVTCACGDQLIEGASCVNCHYSTIAAYELVLAERDALRTQVAELRSQIDLCSGTCRDTTAIDSTRDSQCNDSPTNSVTP